MIQEASKKDISLRLIIRESLLTGIKENSAAALYENQPLSLPDLAVVRCREPFLNENLERQGVAVFNRPRVAAAGNDKALAYRTAVELGLPVLDTVFVPAGMEIPDSIWFDLPWVIKSTTGWGGKEVFLVKSKPEARAIRNQMPHSPLIVQPLCPGGGRDVRVFVVGRQIIAAVLRYSLNDFRANYSLGGSCELYHLSGQDREMVQAIIDELNPDMVGIDFLLDAGGHLLLNEIEDAVGSRTLSLLTGINLLEIFMSHVRERLEAEKP